MSRRRADVLLVASLLLVLVAACTARPTPSASTAALPSQTAVPSPTGTPSSGSPAPSPGTGPFADLRVTLEPFAKVEGGPLAIAAPEDGSGRLFIAAQDGRIWVADADGTVHPDPLVDLRDRLTSGGERGLLGLALHPHFPDDPRAFVNYTDLNGDSVIASLALDPGDSDRLDPQTEEQVLFVDQPFANHNGGDLLFGPDGYLYAFFGDGGSGGDPQNNGQNRDALLGKVLRLDVDHPAGGLPYSAPAGNPFLDAAGRDEVWLWGVRNPWRSSFDRATGDLWIGDVGQGAWEEVDVARAGVGGLNFGWNRMEGSHCYPPGSDCSGKGLTPPVAEYGHDLGCTVVGGYVYRGAAQPALTGVYLFADYCTGRLFAIDPATDEFREPTVVGNGSNGISSFGEDAAGELYVTLLNGEVARVVATRS